MVAAGSDTVCVTVVDLIPANEAAAKGIARYRYGQGQEGSAAWKGPTPRVTT
jgi:hypothetical protein